jgi:hypothetical protein
MDVSQFDPDPDKKPCGSEGVPPSRLDGGALPQQAGVGSVAGGVVAVNGVEQSHRDNLKWAMDTAGTYLRTGRFPTSCPNDSAWYLFRQAIEEPKEFLSRFNQVEAKSTDDAEERKRAQRNGKWAIEELDEMLEQLASEGS